MISTCMYGCLCISPHSYSLSGMLRKMDLLNRYSQENVIRHLDRIYMLRIGDQRKLSEIPGKSRMIIEKLEIHIMQNSGN